MAKSESSSNGKSPRGLMMAIVAPQIAVRTAISTIVADFRVIVR
jgi:hypothetical protein